MTEGLEHLQHWVAAIAERPAVQKGVTFLPRADPDKVVEPARSMLA
jgi:GST-like protein